MEFNLHNLFEAQRKLDEEIQKNHHETYESTLNKRFLAFLVELGEFANSTRCFKFWSNKTSESKERVLDEYADGLHFILSLGISLGFEFSTIEVEKTDEDTTNAILSCYKIFAEFFNKRDLESYVKAFDSFLKICYPLGFKAEDLIDAYYKKLDVNYKRQENNY